jgi:hypothetical protein
VGGSSSGAERHLFLSGPFAIYFVCFILFLEKGRPAMQKTPKGKGETNAGRGTQSAEHRPNADRTENVRKTQKQSVLFHCFLFPRQAGRQRRTLWPQWKGHRRGQL